MMRGRGYLVVGAAVGVALATASLVERGDRNAPVPDDAVAVVNGEPIRRVDFDRAMAAVAADRRDVDDALRVHVLDRMIDEELLVQRGVELGLAKRDPRVRTDLGAAVIELVSSRAEPDDEPPTETALRAFYVQHPEYFVRPGRVVVEQAFFRTSAAAQAGHSLAASGAAFDAVQAIGDAVPVPVPERLLPAAKLRDYLGPTAMRAVLDLEPGQVTAPVRTGAGWHVIRLIDRELGALRPFAEVRGLVVAEYQRRSGDREIRDFLARRRAQSTIAVARDMR